MSEDKPLMGFYSSGCPGILLNDPPKQEYAPKGTMARLAKAEVLLKEYQMALRNHAAVIRKIPREGCFCPLCTLDNETTVFLSHPFPNQEKP